MDGKAFVAEAITDYLGERCSDYDPACPTCRAWEAYDSIIRDDENHKATVERCIAVAEAERKKHDTGSGFDNQPAHAAAFAIRSRLRSLIKEDGADE
jgi:hypothetical protein